MPMDVLTHARWVDRVKKAQLSQNQYHATWKKSLSLYDMSYWREQGYTGTLSSDITPVNYTTTFVSTMVSSIYSRNPKIFVRARRPRYSAFAQVMEELLEHYWDEENLKDLLIETVIDGEIFNVGWMELGYFPSIEALPQPVENATGSASVLQNLISTVQRMFGQVEAPDPAQQGELLENKQPGEFYCLRRPTWDVLTPPGFHNYWEMPYLIVRDRFRAEDFLRHPRFINKAQALITTMTDQKIQAMVTADYANTSAYSLMAALNIQDTHIVDLYTIWDRRSNRVFSITLNAQQPHADDPWPYAADGFPIIPLQFNKVPQTPESCNFYGFSDIEPILPQVIEKSNIRTQMVAHRKRANIVVFVQKGSTTESELSNQQESDALAIIPVSNLQSIQLSAPIAISPAVFQTENSINSDLDRDSGLPLILAGTQQAAQIDRATVAQIASSSASLKTAFRVDRIEAFAKQIARYQVGLFWQYMTSEQVGEYLGRTPTEEEWPKLPENPSEKKRRIRRELELRLEAGSTRPIQDDVLDREQFIRASATFQATSPSLFKTVEKEWWALMAKKFRQPSLEELILKSISQEQQQEAISENQLMAQGMMQIVSSGDDHVTHLTVHQQGGQSPIIQAHRQAHQIKLQEMQSGQRAAQGVQQSAAAPSAAEVNRMGTPGMADLNGQANNLRAGTGGTSVANL